MLSACANFRKDGESAPPTEAGAAVPNTETEMSLKADRSELDALRKDVPEEIKKQNDEIALILSFIVRDSDEDPGKVRDRFNTAIRKKREAIDKKLARSRQDFTKQERSNRDDFVKKSREERDDYLNRRKRSSDDRKRFFDDQEDKRKSFFADQMDKRKDFESQVQATRKDNEDFTREKQSTFNEEWKTYQTRYFERKKQTDLKKRMEQKSRELERGGKPVLPVTPGSGDGAANGSVPSYPGYAPPSGVQPLNASGTRPADSLAEFDKIPPGLGVQLNPSKKGP